MIRIYPKEIEKENSTIKDDFDNMTRSVFRREYPVIALDLWGPEPKITLPRIFRRKKR